MIRLEELRNRTEADSKEIDEVHAKKNEALQEEINNSKTVLEESEKKLDELNAEVQSTKGLADEKSNELEQLKADLASAKAENCRLQREKKRIEGESNGETERKKEADLEIDRLNKLNDNHSKLQQQSEDKFGKNEIELHQLNQKIEETQHQIEVAESLKKKREADIGVTLEAKRDIQKEIQQILSKNDKIEDENKGLQIRFKELESQLIQLNSRIEGTYSLCEKKEKDLRATKSNLLHAEDQLTEIKEQSKKMQKDNEILQVLLDKYKNDVSQHKKLRENEISEKINLLEEKKNLEREVLHKELEARSAKKELEHIQKSKDLLLDDHYQLNKELGALKEHADVLEHQNSDVRYLIAKFVDA